LRKTLTRSNARWRPDGSAGPRDALDLSVLKKLTGHSDIEMTECYAIFEDNAAALVALNGNGFALPKHLLTVVDR
jgi:hypothetical protein